MLVSSDFLGYINRRKREAERGSGPLVSAALKASPGGKEKSPPVEQNIESQRRKGRVESEVEFLNERRSTLNVVL
ncbi:MAG: hypothetical protein LBR80_18775 [Deltaproteobacteria bacterium]|jgi:hypothetical protein|nr:hypothetical protein [Deltaproteobacteria bacterium]